MKIMRLLKRDLQLGTIKNASKFLIVVLLVIIYTVILNNFIEYGMEHKMIFHNGTTMDYLLYIMQGMQVYHFDPQSYFEVPIYWFVLQIGIAYIVAYYPQKDFEEYGVNIFLSAKSKVRWWFSKCIWVVFMAVLYYGILIVCTFAVALLSGAELSLHYSEELSRFLFTGNVQYLDCPDIWLISVMIPFLMTAAISLLQILLSFLLTPVVSFATVCGIYILSAYYTVWFLPGSSTMWLRSAYVDVEGIHPQSSILLAVLIIFISVSVGWIYFDNCDII